MTRSAIATQGYRPFSRLGVATAGYRDRPFALMTPACPPQLTLSVRPPAQLTLSVRPPAQLTLSVRPPAQLSVNVRPAPVLTWVECRNE